MPRASCGQTAIHSWPAFTAIRPASRSTELEQHAVATARIAPFDVAAGLADHPAGAALHTTVNRYLYLTLVVEFVASRRAGLEQRKQRRRRRRMRADLDVGAAGVHQIAVVEQLVLDTHREFGCHVSISIASLKSGDTAHRHARARRNASPNNPVHDRALTNERSMLFSFSTFGVPSTRTKFCIALETSCG